jgi:DNA (cytosine-5)-methyltransferase 1
LFCGAGGITHGLKLAGFKVTFALDKDHDSCESYRVNHPEVDVAEASITDLEPEEILRRAGGHIDLVVGGPSCQSFSTAGRMNGWVRDTDGRKDLWKHMLKVVATVKPKAFLMENVPGMQYWQQDSVGAAILSEFAKLGYVVDKKILLAADYGVPQRRRRLFIVGVRDADAPFFFPAQTHMGGWRRDSLDKWEQERQRLKLKRHLTCWEAIGDLPSLGTGPGQPGRSYARAAGTPFARAMRGNQKVLRDHEVHPLNKDHLGLVGHVPAGGTWRDIPRHELPDRYRGMRRTDSTNLLARLDPTLPAYTITTQFHNVTTGCFTHPYENRHLSVREGARLQTFPDSYEFLGSLTSRCRQIGNAVPPALTAVLAHALAEQFFGGRGRKPAALTTAATPPPPPTDAVTRKRMQAQARRDTRPEVFLRAELAALGVKGYRIDGSPLPGLRRKADLVIRRVKLAIFVDGCFWHGCQTHSRGTKSNTKWWAEKIAANKTRDAETDALLASAGWNVVRVWEHEAPADAAARVHGVLASLEELPARRAG